MLRALVLSLAVLAAAPAMAQSLVGKWDCEGRSGPDMHLRTLQEYRASGQFTHLANIAAGRNGQRFDMSAALNGRWSGDGAVLVEDIRTFRVRSVEINGQDITNTPQGRELARFVRARMVRPDRPSRIRLDTLTDRRLSFRDGRIDATCTRR